MFMLNIIIWNGIKLETIEIDHEVSALFLILHLAPRQLNGKNDTLMALMT